MRVLLFANVMPTFFSPALSGPSYVTGGWISAVLTSLSKTDGLEVGCCFPVFGTGSAAYGRFQNVDYFPVPMERAFSDVIEPDAEARFSDVLASFRPDVIHLFGTESAAALPLLYACRVQGLLPRAVIHMQGVVKDVANRYTAGLPERIAKRYTLRDILQRDSILGQAANYQRRAVNEAEMLSLVSHVSGRTDYDRRACLAVNPKLSYHRCNESLRASFYETVWNEENACAHTIFLSQGHYPLKGLHTLLSALPAVVSRYPDTLLRVAGSNPARADEGLRGKLSISGYGTYIRDLIRKNRLSKRVRFLGTLDEKGMLAEYLHAGLFVCASTVENSPNSLAEAMLLSVPIVSTTAGGIPSVMISGVDGRMVPPSDADAMAVAILAAFDNPAESRRMGLNARAHAQRTHDRKKNTADLVAIYRTISESAALRQPVRKPDGDTPSAF